MRHWLVLCVLLAAMLGGLAQTAVADDLVPPPWRGQISTTSQIWEFMTPIRDPRPDGPAPGGQPPLPSTIIHVEPGPGMEWLQVDPIDQGTIGQRYGVWPLSGWMEATVDNHDPRPENQKLFWMQMTWRPQEGTGAPPVVKLSAPPEFSYPVTELFPVETRPLADGWMYSRYTHTLPFNPPDEFVTISGTVNVDELVIDTWCVPEPSTFILLGMGALSFGAYALRRRKK